MFPDKLCLHWGVCKIRAAFECLHHITICVLNQGHKLVFAIVDLDATPYGYAYLSIGALLYAIKVQRADGFAVHFKFDSLPCAMFYSDTDGFYARILVNIGIDKARAGFLPSEPVTLSARSLRVSENGWERCNRFASFGAGCGCFCTEVSALQRSASAFYKT